MSEDCSICMAEMTDNCVVTYCNHKFHRNCIEQWGDTKKQLSEVPVCPMCRYKPLILVPDLPLKEIRKSYVKERLEREEILKNLSTIIEERNNYRETIINIQRENELLRSRLSIIESMLSEAIMPL